MFQYQDLYDSNYHTPRYFDPAFFNSLTADPWNDDNDDSPRDSVLFYFRDLLLAEESLEVQFVKDMWDMGMDKIPCAREVAQSPDFPGESRCARPVFRRGCLSTPTP